ncbi:MAG: hypothetical protein HY554_10815 [Elusimicrobia bacterium]|nr:hypothetical protein [Elusimicrobiota bacterium]
MLVASALAVLLGGCRGSNRIAAKGVSGNVDQRMTDNSQVTTTTRTEIRAQLAERLELPADARNYLRDLVGDDRKGFDPDKIVALLQQVPIRARAFPKDEVKWKKGSGGQLVLAFLNGNSGPGASMDQFSSVITIRGAVLHPVRAFEPDVTRQDRLWLGGGVLHPTDLLDDDPPLEGGLFSLDSLPAGRHDGQIIIQAKDRDQITRRFVLVVEE